MSLVLASMRAIAFVVITVLPTAIFANEGIENALGGPFTTCTGAIAWTDSNNGVTHVEPMRLAVPDAKDAANIGLFLNDSDFTSDNVFACLDSVCTSQKTVRAAATTNVLRLRKEVGLSGGEIVYAMEAAFFVVNARESQLQVESAQGVGSFICEKELPSGLVSFEQQ